MFGQVTGRIMGIFDKAENEAENVAQKDPNLAQQGQQFGGGQGDQDDMQTAQNTIGQQGGPQDSADQNMGGGYQDQNMGGGYQDQNMGGGQDQNMGGGQDMGGQGTDPNQDMGGGYQDQNQQMGNQDSNQQMGNQDPNMDPNQQGGSDQNMDTNQAQNQNW